MPVLAAAVTIAFTLLAFLCLDLFGLAGVVVWLVVFGLFYWLMMVIKRRVSFPE